MICTRASYESDGESGDDDKAKRLKQAVEGVEDDPVEIHLKLIAGGDLVSYITQADIRKLIPSYVDIQTIRHEKLYDIGREKWSESIFIQVPNEEQAWNVLKMESVMMEVTKGSIVYAVRVQFVRPVQNQDVRKNIREVGDGLAKLKKINARVKEMGAVTVEGSSIPTLPSNFKDKRDMAHHLARLFGDRSARRQLSAKDYAIIHNFEPVDWDLLEAELSSLYDEKCDVLIKLRSLQIEGLEFRFNPDA